MNWKNIDLNSPYERDQNILDPYSFDTLLLEISCNLPEINRETVKKHFIQELHAKTETAFQIMENNLDDIIKKAQQERNIR